MPEQQFVSYCRLIKDEFFNLCEELRNNTNVKDTRILFFISFFLHRYGVINLVNNNNYRPFRVILPLAVQLQD